MKFRPVLMTQQAFKMKSWEGTEWFGVEWPYVPYWDANEEHNGWGIYHKGRVQIEFDDLIEFLAVFKEGEFVCSLELEENILGPAVLTIKDMGNIYDTIKV